LERFYCFEFGFSAKFRVYNFGSDIFQETWGCSSREREVWGVVFSLQFRERAMSSRSSNDATDGAFKMKESSFRQFISRQPGAEFPPEKERYHLYISYACPWASKCYAFMKLKGLEDDVIGLTVSLFSSLLFSSLLRITTLWFCFCKTSVKDKLDVWKFFFCKL
jgi:hypothetical protein